MNNKKQLLKRLFTIGSLMTIAVLLLSACGTFSIQASANPNESGGLDLSAGSQPAADGNGNGMNQTTLILIIVGVVILILVLIALASRGRSKNEPPS